MLVSSTFEFPYSHSFTPNNAGSRNSRTGTFRKTGLTRVLARSTGDDGHLRRFVTNEVTELTRAAIFSQAARLRDSLSVVHAQRGQTFAKRNVHNPARTRWPHGGPSVRQFPTPNTANRFAPITPANTQLEWPTSGSLCRWRQSQVLHRKDRTRHRRIGLAKLSLRRTRSSVVIGFRAARVVFRYDEPHPQFTKGAS